MTPNESGVWVFNGNGSGGRFPSGVFTTVAAAEAWITKNKLNGTLTWYPLDVGVYEWVTEIKDYWKPKREDQKTPEFKQTL